MNQNRRAWILYDWANSAFALTTMAAFFPILFTDFWSQATDAVTTARLGVGNSLAGLIVAIASPILAEIVVVGDRRKRGLVVAAIIGIIGNGALFFIPQGSWFWALSLFVVARVGFQAANLFYDALLPAVACEGERHKVSSLGFAFGYLGCGLLFIVNMTMVVKPEFWGFPNALMGARVSILSVSVWWFIFSTPLMRASLPKESLSAESESIQAIYSRLLSTLHYAFTHRSIGIFLLAYWLYIDGVHSLILMAANYGKILNFSNSTLMIALLVVQLVAFPSAWVLGSVAEKVGVKKVIATAVFVYLVVAISSGWLIHEPWHFIVFAGITGMVQGAIQALSRSLFSLLVPPSRSTELFGLYNTVGRFAVVLGPLLVATIGLLARRMGASEINAGRLGMGSLSILFVLGLLCLIRVPVPSHQVKE